MKGDGDLNGDGYVTGTELGIYLRDKVTYHSNRLQTPQFGKLRDIDFNQGDFVFKMQGKERIWKNRLSINSAEKMNYWKKRCKVFEKKYRESKEAKEKMDYWKKTL